jgi:serine/threonine protein phosphatase 1
MSKGNIIAVIGDVHGCINTLEKIFNKLSRHSEISEYYCVGDMIDRGKYSKEVVEFCIRNSVRPVMGNHEDMLLKAISKSDKLLGFLYKDSEHYYYNGGRETQYSYIHSRLFSNFKKFSEEIKNTGHYDFIKNLPLKYEFKKVIISHAGIIDGGDDVSIIWNRDIPLKLNELQIFGHTPLNEIAYIKNYYANIDTGCVYKRKLTAVIVDTDEGNIDEIIQENYDPDDVE